MDASSRAISPLRQRMIDDMRMCKLLPKTQIQYIRAVKKLTGFVSRSPDTVTVEDLRRYQLHLVDHGTSPVSITVCRRRRDAAHNRRRPQASRRRGRRDTGPAPLALGADAAPACAR